MTALRSRPRHPTPPPTGCGSLDGSGCSAFCRHPQIIMTARSPRNPSTTTPTKRPATTRVRQLEGSWVTTVSQPSGSLTGYRLPRRRPSRALGPSSCCGHSGLRTLREPAPAHPAGICRRSGGGTPGAVHPPDACFVRPGLRSHSSKGSFLRHRATPAAPARGVSIACGAHGGPPSRNSDSLRAKHGPLALCPTGHRPAKGIIYMARHRRATRVP